MFLLKLSKEYLYLYPLAGVVVVILSATQSVLALGEAKLKIKGIRAKWMAQETAWDKLWVTMGESPGEVTWDVYEALKEEDAKIETEEDEFRRQKRLVKKAQKTMRIAEKLQDSYAESAKRRALSDGCRDKTRRREGTAGTGE